MFTPNVSSKRILVGLCAGFLAVVVVVHILSLTLGNVDEPTYAGKPAGYWQQQLTNHDTSISNNACAVLNEQILPQLTNAVFNDTNDSILRQKLVDTLNQLPGVQIVYFSSASRRGMAIASIGEFGPWARSAVPILMKVLQGSDVSLHSAAIEALGEIHSDPDIVIPALIPFLDKDDVNDEAALALANYGNLAKEAVPKLIPLLNAPDHDVQAAARMALIKIDPDAVAKAGLNQNQQKP